VNRNRSDHQHPAGHLWLPVAAIGGLSLVLTTGMELTGAMTRLNGMAAGMVSRGGAEQFPNRLPGWLVWLAVGVLAFGTAAAVLGTAGVTRRVLLWLTAVILTAGWAPVLSLAAYRPEIAAPWVAALWSGSCALFYASRHRMPCDEIPANES